MNYRYLGTTGIKVSELCFGTMTFGGKGGFKPIGEVGQDEANHLVNLCFEAGINFFDTADIYSEGVSEEILGKALGARRKEIILATKVRGKMSDNINDLGLSRHHIIEGCNASLKRLGTDYIDLYQVHSYDPKTPLEETLRALDDLVREGKVRYIGCSNFSAWQLMKALAISEKLLLERFVTLQAYYSLVSRELELELVPLSLDQGLGIIPWSPLAGGILSGKYRRGTPWPSNTRMTNSQHRFLPFDDEHAYTIIDTLENISRSHNASVAQTAINYLLRKPGVASVIIGARTTEQLQDNLRTTDWVLTAEEVRRLDELTKPPKLYPYWMLEWTQQDRM